jgi:hypothetical protein
VNIPLGTGTLRQAPYGSSLPLDPSAPWGEEWAPIGATTDGGSLSFTVADDEEGSSAAAHVATFPLAPSAQVGEMGRRALAWQSQDGAERWVFQQETATVTDGSGPKRMTCTLAAERGIPPWSAALEDAQDVEVCDV